MTAISGSALKDGVLDAATAVAEDLARRVGGLPQEAPCLGQSRPRRRAFVGYGYISTPTIAMMTSALLRAFFACLSR